MAKLKRQYSKLIEAGCDEAGRGCLAGPVVAAAVILPKNKRIVGLDDSKKLSESRRMILKEEIENKALAYAVAFVSPEKIDKINILQASIHAMHLAIAQLKILPEFILVDGNKFNPYPNIAHECIIKGDGKYANIAAASILAKTYRDLHMEELHQEFPHYDWKQNKGYPTAKHRAKIAEFGPCNHHRKSFTLLFQPQLFT